MPFTTALGQNYDCGGFPKNLQDSLALADCDRAAARREAVQKRGKLFGIGVVTTVTASGGRDYSATSAQGPQDIVSRSASLKLPGTMTIGMGNSPAFLMKVR